MQLDEKVRTPVVDYKSIKINDKSIGLSTVAKASFVEPYNKIIIKFTPDISLSQFLIRITQKDEDYDIDLGKKAFWLTSLSGNTDYDATIDVNETNFAKGDDTYRIGLYAQSMLDHS